VANPATAEDDTMAFYELRQYAIRPGKMAAWLELMEQEIIPFQVSKGMVITAGFRGESDDTVYIWMRRFESEAERERLYAAVYQSDEWKNVIAPQIPEMMDRERMVIRRIAPTEKSVIR